MTIVRGNFLIEFSFVRIEKSKIILKIKEIVYIKDEHVDENWDILVGKIRACLVFLFV